MVVDRKFRVLTALRVAAADMESPTDFTMPVKVPVKLVSSVAAGALSATGTGRGDTDTLGTDLACLARARACLGSLADDLLATFFFATFFFAGRFAGTALVFAGDPPALNAVSGASR